MPLNQALLSKLEEAAPGAASFNVNLSALSRWQIGGLASAVVEPRNPVEAANVLSVVRENSAAHVVVGGTSNILFDSAGFDGVVIRIGQAMSDVEFDGESIRAQSGVSVPELARAAGRRGLSGIEHTVGIPGTLGGLVLMNGGSQRRGIGENVDHVTCVDDEGNLLELTARECGFAYRKSLLQDRPIVILAVQLCLLQGDEHEIQKEMDRIIADRASKFPTDYPNCGSTFLSDPEMYKTVGPPGRAIEDAGLKGLRIGDAQVSEKHANFLLNLGSATSDDVLRLIAIIRHTVFRRTGYYLDCEVRHISPRGITRPAHVAALQKWGRILATDASRGE